MEKICLVEAGDYLLGIDSAAIAGKMDVDAFIAEERTQETSAIALASLFDQTPVISQPALTVLELKTSVEPLTLVVDRVIGETSSPDHFATLPPLYPKLARDCCPRVMIHDGQPVLLLDGGGLGAVLAKLESGCGEIFLGTLGGRVPREEKNRVGESTDGKDSSNHSAAEFDDRTFAMIVSWTIGEYLGRASNENRAIHIDELPAEYVSSLRLQNMRKALLQKLIDKTVERCGTVDDETLRRLRKTSAGMGS